MEKGHLIGFSDGALTVPAKFPKHAQQRRAAGEGRAPARPEEPADAQESAPPADAQERVPPEIAEQSQEEPKVEEPKVEIQEEVKKDETADQLAE